MNDYYASMLNALATGKEAKRYTFAKTGEEAIFLDGKPYSSTLTKGFQCSSDFDISKPAEDAEHGGIRIPSDMEVSQNQSYWEKADLVETIKTEPHIVMFGFGHVGKALYDSAVLLGMKTTVIDDREEMLSEERCPSANRILADFERLDDIALDVTAPYITIFTHGHSYDAECLKYALRRNCSYIGMIGSKRKVQATFEKLKAEGFSEESLAKVHSPIGLGINAVTPEEIAISIMAEIISVFRRDKEAVVLSPTFIKQLSEKHGILVRIIAKRGSAPREQGAMMLVTADETFSTIGGGAIEENAIAEARIMLETKTDYKTKDYILTKSGEIGMICGGDVTLSFKRI